MVGKDMCYKCIRGQEGGRAGRKGRDVGCLAQNKNTIYKIHRRNIAMSKAQQSK